MQTHAVPLHTLPAAVHAWIKLSGSMTQAIQSVTGQAPAVRIKLSQAAPASAWEAELLQGSNCFVRHIELLAGEQLCLTARSLALQNSPAALALANLGERPLADLLFNGAWVQGDIHAITTNTGGFGRAAVWRNSGGYPLLVQEIFAPEFVRAYQPHSTEKKAQLPGQGS